MNEQTQNSTTTQRPPSPRFNLHLARPLLRLLPRARLRLLLRRLRLLLHRLRLLRHARQPVQEHGREGVEHDEHPQDAEVAPPQRVVRVDGLQELVRRRDGAVRALVRGARVDERAAAAGRDERRHVRAARLPRARREAPELVGRADHHVVRHADREHRVDEVREGRHAVHEDPEAREHRGRGEHAAEDECEGEHQVGDVAARLGVLDGRDDHVGEGRGEEEELPDQQEHEPGAGGHAVGGRRVVVQPDGVVPGEEDEHGHERIPGQLDDNVGDHECLPAIRLARALAHLVEGALGDEVRHDLLHELAEDGEQHEDGEHLVLQLLLRGACVEEGEADEEPRPDAEAHLGVDIRRRAPVLCEDALGDLPQLHAEGGCELAKGCFVIGGGGGRRFVGAISLQAV